MPSNVGLLVITLMTPPVALRPYKVPCGPRSTSMRCTSYSSIGGCPDSASFTETREPMPRILKFASDKSLVVAERFGTKICRSARPTICRSSIMASSKTLMAMGTFCAFSSMR